MRQSDIAFVTNIDNILKQLPELMVHYSFSKYLEELEQAMALSNQFIDREKPWTLKESDTSRMQDILFILLEQIFKITKYLYPVIPIGAEKMLTQIGAPYEFVLKEEEHFPDEVLINDPEAVFPKIDVSQKESFDVFEKD